ncbi:MAG: helix-turn-helix transcriptional regulator [Chloroflexota bacterium]
MPKNDDSFLKSVGQKIREARVNRGLSQEEFAVLIGKTQNVISRYENGQQAMRISELPAIAEALIVPISYFFEDATIEVEIATQVSQLSPGNKRALQLWLTSLLNTQPKTPQTIQTEDGRISLNIDLSPFFAAINAYLQENLQEIGYRQVSATIEDALERADPDNVDKPKSEGD